MNKLFYAATYSHANNDWARFLITVSPREEADGSTAEVQLEHQMEGTDRKVRTCTFVCTTNETIFMEV